MEEHHEGDTEALVFQVQDDQSEQSPGVPHLDETILIARYSRVRIHTSHGVKRRVVALQVLRSGDQRVRMGKNQVRNGKIKGMRLSDTI